MLCLLENFDMHLFGGTAMINIPGALYSFSLSIINWIVLSVIGYYGLIIHTSTVKFRFLKERKLTFCCCLNRILFKIFSFRSIVV